MTDWIVTRHTGTVDWMRARGIAGRVVAHLDPADIGPGDTVHGTLPVNLVADITARGARYNHLVLTLPLAQRGTELTCADLDRAGATLVAYEARRIDP